MSLIKELFGWVPAALLLGFIIAIVATGGGILSPEFWHIMIGK